MYRLTTTMTMFALALGFHSAHAAPPQNVPSVVVHFADLDLSRSEGTRVLYQRLKGAAETVCAPLDDRDLARHMRFTACVQSAISAAVAKVDQPTLAAYYEAKTNGRNAIIQIAQKQSR
jgi:UrcA family protein